GGTGHEGRRGVRAAGARAGSVSRDDDGRGARRAALAAAAGRRGATRPGGTDRDRQPGGEPVPDPARRRAAGRPAPADGRLAQAGEGVTGLSTKTAFRLLLPGIPETRWGS